MCQVFEVFEFGYLVVGYIKDAEVCLLVVSEEKGGGWAEIWDTHCVPDPKFQ